MSKELSINIKLGNRAFRLKVDESNESTVRDSAKSINDKLEELKKTFPGRDETDYFAMTLIDFITSQKDNSNAKKLDESEMMTHLEQINNLLDS